MSFLGARGRLEAELVPKAGYEVDLLDLSGIDRKNPLKAARAATQAANSWFVSGPRSSRVTAGASGAAMVAVNTQPSPGAKRSKVTSPPSARASRRDSAR